MGILIFGQALRCAVVLMDRSASGSLASGRLRPDPRWSNSTTRQASGSKKRRWPGVQPEPGPPWRNSAGLPSGLPQHSQYTRCPSPASSMPLSYGSTAGNLPPTVHLRACPVRRDPTRWAARRDGVVHYCLDLAPLMAPARCPAQPSDRAISRRSTVPFGGRVKRNLSLIES